MRTYRESAVTFGPSGSLVGVLTAPAGSPAAADRPVIVIPNAGVVHRVGPNRLHVRLARALAPLGYLVLRFDLSGVGDSDPRPDAADLARGVHRDIADAITLLETRCHARSFVICGLCSGANNGFRYAVADTRVVGAALIDAAAYRTPRYYVAHYGRRVLRPEPWLNLITGRHPLTRRLFGTLAARPLSGASPPVAAEFPEPSREEMDAGLGALVARRAELLMVFTGGASERYNYSSQFRDTFPRHGASEHIRVEYYSDADHTFSREAAKIALIDALSRWLSERVRAPEAQEPPPSDEHDIEAITNARLMAEATSVFSPYRL